MSYHNQNTIRKFVLNNLISLGSPLQYCRFYPNFPKPARKIFVRPTFPYKYSVAVDYSLSTLTNSKAGRPFLEKKVETDFYILLFSQAH